MSPPRATENAMSIATAAFDAALRRLGAQVVDPPQRRPAYDVFGPPATPLPTLGGMPKRGAIAAAARALEAGRTTCVELTELALANIAQDEWTSFVEVARRGGAGRGPRRDAEPPPAAAADRCTASRSRSRTSSTSPGSPPGAARTPTTTTPTEDADAVARLRAAGRRHPRQGLHPRVRPRRDQPAEPQPPRPDPHPGRLERRLGHRRRHRHGPGLARHRHPGLDPRAGRAVGRRRLQADATARCRPTAWSPLVVDDGPRRADGRRRWPTPRSSSTCCAPAARRSRPAVGARRQPTLRVGVPRAPRPTGASRASRPRWPADRRARRRSVGAVDRDRPAHRRRPRRRQRRRAWSSAGARRRPSTAPRAWTASLYWAGGGRPARRRRGVLAIDYLDAQRIRGALAEELLAVLRDTDVLAMPTVPIVAPPARRLRPPPDDAGPQRHPLELRRLPRDLGAVRPTDGLPVGLQLVAAPGRRGVADRAGDRPHER